MDHYPHLYQTSAHADTDQEVLIKCEGLHTLSTMPPQQFGGPGDMWSPETLLVASVADCFILSFRAIARASKLDWIQLDCDADGVLDRVDNVTRFTHFNLRATLTVPAGVDEHKATRLLEKAEAVCLISNSLNAEKHLETKLVIQG
jgi:organic hydroperoxide reductase OsmC/OhrA